MQRRLLVFPCHHNLSQVLQYHWEIATTHSLSLSIRYTAARRRECRFCTYIDTDKGVLYE